TRSGGRVLIVGAAAGAATGAGAVLGAAGLGAGTGSGVFAGAGAAAGGALGGGAGSASALPSPSVSITTRTEPTAAISPALADMLLTTPATGEVNSTVALSVSTSTS